MPLETWGAEGQLVVAVVHHVSAQVSYRDSATYHVLLLAHRVCPGNKYICAAAWSWLLGVLTYFQFNASTVSFRNLHSFWPAPFSTGAPRNMTSCGGGLSQIYHDLLTV